MDKGALMSLADFLEPLSQPGFQAGAWVTPPPAEDGTVGWPYVDYCGTARAFRDAAYEKGWLNNRFRWPEWAATENAQRLRDETRFLAAASSDDLARLLTVCIRQERFSEGALLAAFDSGLILGIVRRANTILSNEEAC